MRRLLTGLVLALAVPVTVVAGSLDGGLDARAPQGSASPGHTQPSGVVRGSVIELSLAAGTLRVHAGRGAMTLEGTPQQLAGLNPGDVVELPYVNYDGHLWLSPEVGAARSSLDGLYANQARVRGAVQAIERGAGMITVRGERFRLHPAELQGILPGMSVDLIYTDVGGVSWVVGILPAGAGSGGGHAG